VSNQQSRHAASVKAARKTLSICDIIVVAFFSPKRIKDGKLVNPFLRSASTRRCAGCNKNAGIDMGIFPKPDANVRTIGKGLLQCCPVRLSRSGVSTDCLMTTILARFVPCHVVDLKCSSSTSCPPPALACRAPMDGCTP
jgi:hypothetical protein